MKFKNTFKPMLLKQIQKPFNDKDYLFELKFDGIRAIIHADNNNVFIFNRYEKEITSLYPELQNISKIIKCKTILDGEIVLFDNCKPNFSKLQERTNLKDSKKINYLSENFPVCFIAFDILYQRQDLTDKSLIERKKILEKIPDNNYFIKARYIFEHGIKLFQKIKKLDLEGIVAKKIDSQYEIDNRSDKWLKIKNLKKEFFYIGGYYEKVENAVVSLYLGEYYNEKLYFIGKVTMSKRNKLYKILINSKIIVMSPFINFNEKKVNYLKPSLICQVAYLERTKNNYLRQPIFQKYK